MNEDEAGPLRPSRSLGPAFQPEGHPRLLPREYERGGTAKLVLDHLAGHLSYDLVRWFFDYRVMPLYTPMGDSWRNLAEPVQRIIVRRALSGQRPKSAQEVIDWLEQTVEGWNKHPTPFVWNGKSWSDAQPDDPTRG